MEQKDVIKIAKPSKSSPEIEWLKNNKEINRDSKLKQLNPYLDQEGILLVGGRLTTTILVVTTLKNKTSTDPSKTLSHFRTDHKEPKAKEWANQNRKCSVKP